MLTATHCFQGNEGATLVFDNGTRQQIELVERVEKWPIADLTILTLKNARPGPYLKLAERLPADGTTLTMLGRGQKTAKPGAPSDDAFTKARVNLASPTTAIGYMRSEELITPADKERWETLFRMPSFICTISPAGRPGPCLGDSGGPLILEKGLGNDELVGVAHRVSNTFKGSCDMAGTKYHYVVYTNIPHYLQTRSAVQQAAAVWKRCAYVGRVRQPNGSYRCPKLLSWDTGAPHTMSAQCATTQQCAQAANTLLRSEGIAGTGGVWQHRN